jgi:hypothetical protein
MDSEEELIRRAQDALNHCNWVIGECAAQWTQRYARGRTDADFGLKIGLSGDQVYQRRRVWETFSDVRESYLRVRWSHFYAAVNWVDAAECLQWADETSATVAEMKAWRRAQHGEDLSERSEDETAAAAWALDALSPTVGVVRVPPHEGMRSDESRGPRERERPPWEEPEHATLTAAGRELEPGNEAYAPFGKSARGAAPTDVAERPSPSAEQVLRRLTAALERCNLALTPEVIERWAEIDPGERKRLLTAFRGLSARLAGLK